MKQKIYILLISTLTILFFSCQKDEINIQDSTTQNENVFHLGKRKQIPFTVDNMTQSYEKLSDNKTSALNNLKHINKSSYTIETTHYYYKFLPKDSLEYYTLVNDSILSVSDLPFEHQLQESDSYYKDPSLSNTDYTYLYSVLPIDYALPQGIEAHRIADLHFTMEDEISENPTDAELELISVMYDLNLEARKASDNLDEEEKAELKYFPKDGSLNYSITYQQALNLGYTLEDLIIDFSEIDIQEKSSSWKPSGTLTVREDAINQNLGVRGARVKVRKWGWLVIKKAKTNNNGYFQTSSTRTKNVKYSVFFRHTPFFSIKDGTVFWEARYVDGSNYKKKPWNKNFNSGKRKFHSLVHNAAYDYYTRVIHQYNLSFPGINKKIVAKEWYNTSSHTLSDVMSAFALYNIRITIGSNGVYRGSVGIYATTVHELTHAGHRNMDNGMFSIFHNGSCNRAILIESWAEGVETIVTNQRYLSLNSNYIATNKYNNTNLRLWNDYRQTHTVSQMNKYTPIVTDLIDNVNQNTIPNIPGNQPIDRVSGYSLNQIQNALKNCRDISCWENKLRNNYNNPTKNHLAELFDYVKFVRNNNLSTPCN